MTNSVNTDVFFKSLSLPEKCGYGNTIFKKQFYEQVELTSTDKKILKNNVDKIILQYNLSPSTINIQPYSDDVRDYPEIQIIEVRLSAQAKFKRITEIIMRAIPYPMILQLTHGTTLMIIAGNPRINMADRQKHTIEEFVFSPWMDSQKLSQMDKDFLNSIQASNLSFTNYYRFYSDFVNQLHLYNVANLVGKTQKNINPQKAQKLYVEIKEIERELVAIRVQLKKESMFNRKVELNVDIKRLQAKQKQIKGFLTDKGVEDEKEVG